MPQSVGYDSPPDAYFLIVLIVEAPAASARVAGNRAVADVHYRLAVIVNVEEAAATLVASRVANNGAVADAHRPGATGVGIEEAAAITRGRVFGNVAGAEAHCAIVVETATIAIATRSGGPIVGNTAIGDGRGAAYGVKSFFPTTICLAPLPKGFQS